MCSFPPIVFLSFFGIASIGLSCLVALFLYHVVFGIQYLGILNGVAAFVIVGIGKHVHTPNLPVLPCRISCLQETEGQWWQMHIEFSNLFPPLPVSEIFAGQILRGNQIFNMCPYCEQSINLPPLFPGVDDVFVFINTYRQATHLKDLRLRMIHTIQTAGKATFFTSLTTAAAYAANIFSQVHCSCGIWGFLLLPEALIEREAASTIFLHCWNSLL